MIEATYSVAGAPIACHVILGLPTSAVLFGDLEAMLLETGAVIDCAPARLASSEPKKQYEFMIGFYDARRG